MPQHLGLVVATSAILGAVAVLLVLRALAGRRRDLPFQKDTRNLEAEELDFYTAPRYRDRYSQLDILDHIRRRLAALVAEEEDERRRYVLETRLENVALLLAHLRRKFDRVPAEVDAEAAADIDATHPIVTELGRQPTRYDGPHGTAMIRNSLKARLHAWVAERQARKDRP